MRYCTFTNCRPFRRWDVYTIKQLLPYVTVSEGKSIGERLGERLQHGEQTALLRFATTVSNSEEDKKAAENYLGQPSAVLFRYKYNYKNLLQYGVTGDKDAGEQFFKGAQKNGFDFYSFHFFARKLGYCAIAGHWRFYRRVWTGAYTVAGNGV